MRTWGIIAKGGRSSKELAGRFQGGLSAAGVVAGFEGLAFVVVFLAFADRDAEFDIAAGG